MFDDSVTMVLLTEEDRKNIISYKYSGGDSSPVYKYVLSPFAQYCVDRFIPLWFAPNLVTSLGLATSILAVIATLIVNPTLGNNAPRWMHFLTGFSVFAYQTFDNMDGKQARRTGSSSALGMVFDHGCDALNAVIMCIPLASVVGTGWTPSFYFCLWSGLVPFYFQTWEEYYVGSMVLPPFNGPTEGLLLATIVCFITGFVGTEWWHEEIFELSSAIATIPHINAITQVDTLFGSITRFKLMFAFVVTVSGFTVLFQTISVVSFVKKKKTCSPIRALIDLLPFLVFFPCIMYWNAVSEIGLKRYPLIMLCYVLGASVEMVVHIMLKHICRGKLKPFERYGAWCAVLLPMAMEVDRSLYPGTNTVETYLLVLLAVTFSLNTLVFLYQICTEFASALDIYVMKLGKRHRA